MLALAKPRLFLIWGQLLIGLLGYALAITLMIRSHLGLGPWDAFHVGMSLWLPITVGVASILVGVGLQIGTWFIGVRPGPGTIANMILIGVFIDLLLPIVPETANWLLGVLYYVSGILICGLSTGLYIGAGLGKGPRDGLMVALSQRTGWSIRTVRTLIELTVLLFGTLMGLAAGRWLIGVGTIMFAVGIGPAAQWGMKVCGVLENGEQRNESTKKHTSQAPVAENSAPADRIA